MAAAMNERASLGKPLARPLGSPLGKPLGGKLDVFADRLLVHKAHLRPQTPFGIQFAGLVASLDAAVESFERTGSDASLRVVAGRDLAEQIKSEIAKEK